MKRVVSVWLPDWPITRRSGALRTPPPEDPFVLVERTGRGLVVQAANRSARALGVRIGQPHADARALRPGLESAQADPREDARALKRLALWCERFSPAVAIDHVGPRMEGLVLDITGAAHLWGGEPALLAEIEGRLRAAGVPARAAVADTPGAAWALARFGRPEADGRIVPPGGTRAALAPLPVESLRLAEPAVVLLKRFGLRRIGDLYALPRAALARRFQGAAKAGEAALQVVLRLDQALGEQAETLEAVRAAPTYRVWRNFAEPILVTEGVDARLPELAEALAAQLERDGCGARRVVLTAFRVDGRAVELAAGFSRPARAEAHLTRVLRDAGLERLDLGFGADALMLAAPAVEPVTAEQAALEQEAFSGDLPALVDRLQARLGAAAVRRPASRESWIPERSEVLERADALPRPAAPPDPTRLRPLLLLDPPEPAEAVLALTPDYPPRRFTWRRISRQVVRAWGPERVSPEWWRDGLPPPPEDAERPVLKVAREDVEHLERQATARQQGSRKVSKPGVCVPALPNATGLEGRRPALSLVPEPEPEDAIPAGRTLDGYPPPPEVMQAASEKAGPAQPLPPLPRTRDYFLVEDDAGGCFWLFREGLFKREPGDPAWWVHGASA